MQKKIKIDIIFEKRNIFIGKTNLDITKDILEIKNKKIKKISINDKFR